MIITFIHIAMMACVFDHCSSFVIKSYFYLGYLALHFCLWGILNVCLHPWPPNVRYYLLGMRANQWKVKYKEEGKGSFEIEDACLTPWAPVWKNGQVSKILMLYWKFKANSGCNSTAFTRFAHFIQNILGYRCNKKKRKWSIIHWNYHTDTVECKPFHFFLIVIILHTTYETYHLNFRKQNSVSSNSFKQQHKIWNPYFFFVHIHATNAHFVQIFW